MQRLETLNVPARQSSVRPLAVLVVDSEEIRAEYTYALSATGFDVDAYGAAPHDSNPLNDRPSLIVVDVSAERGGGWLRIQRLKRDPGTRNVPVVALVAEVGVETQEHARREGCVAVCLATCPPHALAAGLRAVLERAARTANSARP
jgi:DNA-binding response OmpR family regulator